MTDQGDEDIADQGSAERAMPEGPLCPMALLRGPPFTMAPALLMPAPKTTAWGNADNSDEKQSISIRGGSSPLTSYLSHSTDSPSIQNTSEEPYSPRQLKQWTQTPQRHEWLAYRMESCGREGCLCRQDDMGECRHRWHWFVSLEAQSYSSPQMAGLISPYFRISLWNLKSIAQYWIIWQNERCPIVSQHRANWAWSRNAPANPPSQFCVLTWSEPIGPIIKGQCRSSVRQLAQSRSCDSSGQIGCAWGRSCRSVLKADGSRTTQSLISAETSVGPI